MCIFIGRERVERERDRARGKICTVRVEGSNVCWIPVGG